MKKFTKFTIFLFLFVIGCSYNQMKEVEFSELNERAASLASCFNSKVNQEFIINSEDEYRTTFKKTNDPNALYCRDVEMPPVDFSTNTLLGKYTSTGGCGPPTKKVFRDDYSKKIIYEIGVSQLGSCEMLVRSLNLILIQKIPNDYTVDFKLK